MTKTERRALEAKAAELRALIATGTSVDLSGDLAQVERELCEPSYGETGDVELDGAAL